MVIAEDRETPLARPPRTMSLGRRETLWGLVFLSPWLIGLVVFTALPIVASLALSLTNFNILHPEELRFVGFNHERPRSRDGWEDASRSLGLIYFHGDRYDLSPEDAETFSALMSVDNAELPAAHAVEFLGG